MIFAALSLALICFIFSNSLQSRSESSARSSVVAEALKPILDPNDKVGDDAFHNFVRKAAHFAEFAALGFSLMGFADCLAWKGRRWRLLTPPAASLLIAATDETIQIFSQLRGPGIKDVLLDFCGAVCGAACMLLLSLLLRRLKKRRKNIF